MPFYLRLWEYATMVWNLTIKGMDQIARSVHRSVSFMGWCQFYWDMNMVLSTSVLTFAELFISCSRMKSVMLGVVFVDWCQFYWNMKTCSVTLFLNFFPSVNVCYCLFFVFVKLRIILATVLVIGLVEYAVIVVCIEIVYDIKACFRASVMLHAVKPVYVFVFDRIWFRFRLPLCNICRIFYFMFKNDICYVRKSAFYKCQLHCCSFVGYF